LCSFCKSGSGAHAAARDNTARGAATLVGAHPDIVEPNEWLAPRLARNFTISRKFSRAENAAPRRLCCDWRVIQIHGLPSAVVDMTVAE
jgi:hypothetical protein